MSPLRSTDRMEKKRKIRLLPFITLVSALLLVWLLGRLVIPKYDSGITEGALIGAYYESKTPHEVIFIGDCEVYEAFSPVTLFGEYGVSSFVRGTAQQLIWQSRYILEETLARETPKAVVLGICSMKYGEPQSEAYNRMTLDGMRLSPYKLRSVWAGKTGEETVLSYLFPLLRYHERITELTKEDFTYLFKRPDIGFNGFLMHTETEPYVWLPADTGIAEPFSDRCRKELEAIAEICGSKGVTLILVKSPCLYPYWSESYDTALEAFAEEHGIVYLNANAYEAETGIDWSTDTCDGGMHLNVSGAEKYTHWFAEKALLPLGLTDFRNDPAVKSEFDPLTEKYEAAKAAPAA